MSYEIGDIVVKTNGKSPMEIYRRSGNRYYCKYLNSGQNTTVYDSEIKLYVEKEVKMSDALYQIDLENGTKIYGVHVGTTRNGQYLIEEKGSGVIHTVNKDKLEEVIPYSVEVYFSNGSKTHVQIEPDKLKVGDVLLSKNGEKIDFAYVTKIDTKNKKALTNVKFVRVLTEKI